MYFFVSINLYSATHSATPIRGAPNVRENKAVFMQRKDVGSKSQICIIMWSCTHKACFGNNSNSRYCYI